MKKEQVKTHADNYGPSLPAVNVKVYGSTSRVKLPLDLGTCNGRPVKTHPGFTQDWIEQHVKGDVGQFAFESVCESAWETLSADAVTIFGPHVKLKQQGRSGGWAVIEGLPPIESWDAVMLAKWARFAKYAAAIVDDVPRAMVEWIYFNVWEAEQVRAEQALEQYC